MNHFICGFIFSFLLAKVNGLELPDYTTFLQDPEVLDGNVFIDDSTDLFADTANTGNNCLSYDDSDNLFSLNDVARVRPRSPCPNPAAPQTPLPPYTDIYNTDDILNKLSGSSSPSPPVIPGTDRDSNILNLENQLNLPSFIPTHKTTTDDDDDICPREFMGDSQIPVCDTGSFNRNAEVLPGAVCFTIYGVRPCRFQIHQKTFLIVGLMIHEIPQIHRCQNRPLSRTATTLVLCRS